MAVDGGPLLRHRGFFQMLTPKLFDTERRERVLKKNGVDFQVTTLRLHICDFIKGTEEAKLDGGILLRVAQWAAMGLDPGENDRAREKKADGIGVGSVGGDVEDVFSGLRLIGRGTFADEIILIHVSLRSGVGFETTYGHKPPNEGAIAAVGGRDDATEIADTGRFRFSLRADA